MSKEFSFANKGTCSKQTNFVDVYKRQVKSFSSCFWDIGHRASSSDWNSFTVCAPCAAQAMARFVCKKARP